MVLKVKGIVIKESDTGEAGKRIVIITKEHGKMLLSARGAKKITSKTMAGTQLFSYCEFTLFEGKGFYSVTQADVIESFYGISEDIEALAYGAYILEITERASFEELENNEIFDLLLRTLFILSKGKYNPRLVAEIFIIRLVRDSGFMGDLECCQNCGKPFENGAWYSAYNEEFMCMECVGENGMYIGKGALKAVKYIAESGLAGLFRFNVSAEVLEQLWQLADEYRKIYFGERYKTLDYINNMKFSY